MPLHRHECESCGHRFRVLVTPGTQDETPTCPECGSAATRRLMPLVAVQFKGSGYYKTDYGRKVGGRSNGTETESRNSGPTESSPDSKDFKSRSETNDSTTSAKTSSRE